MCYCRPSKCVFLTKISQSTSPVHWLYTADKKINFAIMTDLYWVQWTSWSYYRSWGHAHTQTTNHTGSYGIVALAYAPHTTGTQTTSCTPTHTPTHTCTVKKKGLLWLILVISVALNIVANHWVRIRYTKNVLAHKFNHSSRKRPLVY